MARGFDIKNTRSMASVSRTTRGIVTGAVDSLGYETIEYETKRIEADYSTPFIESGSASRTCGRRSGAG